MSIENALKRLEDRVLKLEKKLASKDKREDKIISEDINWSVVGYCLQKIKRNRDIDGDVKLEIDKTITKLQKYLRNYSETKP